MKYYGDGRGSSKVVLSINLDKCKLMTKVKWENDLEEQQGVWYED